ncbi:MAG: pyridoxamine kinase [Acutalibacteraceae bacterium]|nr:pyridoxamine kinase [Acutalibacteraceae bacterium]
MRGGRKLKSQKRIAAIHDVSGIGKCSLTAAIPILSAAGHEAAVMPTAVLSTHTGDITGFTYRDLTDDLIPFMNHWKSLNVSFDGIYSGYLGSVRQIDIVCKFIDEFRSENTVVVVDPAMADGGRMYTNFDLSFAREMSVLCRKADIIVPNITEAAFLLGEEYIEPPYSKEYIESIMKRLLAFGPKTVVLTGVAFEEDKIGCGVCLENGETFYAFSDHYPGTYYGTGDIFASALTGAYLRGKDIFESAKLALEFTCDAIRRTYEAQTDTRLGVNFEQGLGGLIKNLGGF